MKRFKSLIAKLFRPETAIWAIPVVLIVPNLSLDITEAYSPAASMANLLLPLGIYLLLTACSPKIGRTILLMIPLMVFAAFQIVLLSLYHGSIIGVDMFLNVVTTNTSEIMELLGNLIVPMLVIVLLYIPPICWAAVACRRRLRTAAIIMRRARTTGAVTTAVGIGALLSAMLFDSGYRFDEDFFPVNVVKNLIIAVERTSLTADYPQTSAGYTFNAVPTHPADRKELYVLVIGETARADNFQLLGYGRPTNPRLSTTTGIVAFSRALSESNTTHKSVPMLLSVLSAANYDSIYSCKSVITAFREAGFATAFLSMQRFNRSFIDYFAAEADSTDFIRERRDRHPAPLYDDVLIDEARNVYRALDSRKALLVLHAYGSHFNYSDRYPAEAAVFTPDRISDATAKERATLINAYDNSIRHTDTLLSGLIAELDSLADVDCALIYTSDHGEDIFDDDRGRFLHASPVPTYWQLHVPLLIWMNSAYRTAYPDIAGNIEANSAMRVSTSESTAPTLLNLAGIKTSRDIPDSLSVASAAYRMPEPVYLNDRNRAVSLREAGFTDADFDMLRRMSIVH